mmetsp:Transcript_7366/g.29589  ORF Transcript_7366/g.29589 Transcript_7366/m.29589 type:complete len:241 (+) Transcript_7366:1553-2275(+)
MLLSDALCRMFAPLSRSALREELDPFAAATCSAEYPPRISPFTAAPSRTSSFTIAPCPLCDATCSAVHPCAFFASKFAPFHSPKTSAASSAFARAASCSAVSPCSSFPFTSAPRSSNNRHTSACPHCAAVMSAVAPRSSRSSTAAPATRSALAVSASPSSHAACSGVCRSCFGPCREKSSSSRRSALAARAARSRSPRIAAACRRSAASLNLGLGGRWSLIARPRRRRRRVVSARVDDAR